MRKILTVGLIGIAFFCFGQENIQIIKKSVIKIKTEWELGNYYSTTKSLDTIVEILNDDVIGFFDLKKSYDSELKQKVFLESTEGAEKKKILEQKKENLKKQNLYIEIKGYDLKYNLTKKSIEINIKYSNFGNNYSGNSYHIQLDYLVLNHQNKCIGKKSVFQVASGDYYINQNVLFKLLDEAIALKIEENENDVIFAVFFKATGTIPVNIKLAGFSFKKYLVHGNISKVVIYNKSTNEVYHVIK